MYPLVSLQVVVSVEALRALVTLEGSLGLLLLMVSTGMVMGHHAWVSV
jgi:hypothetical protein